MADNTKPIPPVPNKSDLLEPGDKNKKMSATWIRWMIQLRDKINLINATIASLSGFSGSGFISADGAGEVNGRTIQGTTGNISITNGDGVSGNPVVNLVDTAVTPGTYANTNLTVDEFGRITNATNGSASGAPLTTKGDLFGYDTGDARIPVGTDGYVLTADSSSPTGLSYQPPGTPTLPVTTKGDLLGFSTVPDRIPVGTNGQVPIADSSAPTGISWGSAIGSFSVVMDSTTYSTTSTSIAYNTSIPTSTQGDAISGLDITISPVRSTSKLLYTVSIPMVYNSSSAGMRFAVFRDSGTSAIFTRYTQLASSYGSCTFQFYVTSGSTSSTTFRIRWGVSGGTGYLGKDSSTTPFGGTMVSTVTVQEIF